MNSFGQLLKDWRSSRGLSQMQLGLEANISSKHLSFLENGKSKPSREMIIKLSNSLDIPLSERNILFSAAGFAEAYSRLNIDQPEMKAIKDALLVILNNHMPYPAVVFDWDWNILLANEAQQKLTMSICEIQPNFPKTTNILELLFDPNGFRPFISNWNEVASLVLQRLHREKIMYQDRHSERLKSLLSYPNIPDNWQSESFLAPAKPMVNLSLTIGELSLNLFSTLTTFGTAIDVTLQELMIEQYFPLDVKTRHFFE